MTRKLLHASELRQQPSQRVARSSTLSTRAFSFPHQGHLDPSVPTPSIAAASIRFHAEPYRRQNKEKILLSPEMESLSCLCVSEVACLLSSHSFVAVAIGQFLPLSLSQRCRRRSSLTTHYKRLSSLTVGGGEGGRSSRQENKPWVVSHPRKKHASLFARSPTSYLGVTVRVPAQENAERNNRFKEMDKILY